MSIWSDMEDRSIGLQKRKEDIKEENVWEIDERSKWRTSETILDEIEKLKSQQVKLQDGIADLRRELNTYKWRKALECNFF